MLLCRTVDEWHSSGPLALLGQDVILPLMCSSIVAHSLVPAFRPRT